MDLLHWAHAGIYRGCFGVLWLLFTIYAIVNIVSSRASSGAKVLWIVVVVVFPCVGPIAWLLIGPRQYGY